MALVVGFESFLRHDFSREYEYQCSLLVIPCRTVKKVLMQSTYSVKGKNFECLSQE